MTPICRPGTIFLRGVVSLQTTSIILLLTILTGVSQMCSSNAYGVASQFDCRTLKTATCQDQLLFKNIQVYARSIQTARIWEARFNLQGLPLYLVHWDGRKADRGFLMHSPKSVAGASLLAPQATDVHRIYRYDKALRAAEKTPNGLFDMNFVIQGTPYFMMLYTDFNEPQTDAQATSRDEWLRILVHEAFHIYQTDWIYPDYGEQIEADYPLTRDILSLSLLELAIVSSGFKSSDKGRHVELLKMFTAVRHEKIAQDPSGRRLIRNMDNVQEYLEGTAKYFEVLTAEQFDPGFSRDHYAFEIDEPLKNGFQDQHEMKDFFTFGMWYFTGAIVLKMMSSADILFIESIQSGQTPYDVATAHFNLTPKMLSMYLERAKREFNFPALKNKAAGYITNK